MREVSESNKFTIYDALLAQWNGENIVNYAKNALANKFGSADALLVDSPTMNMTVRAPKMSLSVAKLHLRKGNELF